MEFEEKLNYIFNDKALLELALTHCSLTGERNEKNNQRLEFLGDAVLENVISGYIYEHFEDYDEGKMTRLRASIVSEKPLALAAEQLELSRFVRLGTGLKQSGGDHAASVLSDTLEAVFAAVYLDGGFFEAKRVILAVLDGIIKNPSERANDYKTDLQEKLFRYGTVKVEYRLLEHTGDAQNGRFVSAVYCNGKLLGTGEGTSKKRSEQAAAQAALGEG